MYIEDITTAAKVEFTAWVVENAKNTPDTGAWVSDLVDNTLANDSAIRRYEMSEWESKSGNPEVFYITDDMLVWAKAEERPC